MPDRTEIISANFERVRASRVRALSCCLIIHLFQMAIKSTSAFNAKIAAAFNGRRFGLQALKAIETSHNCFDGFWIVLDDPKPVRQCVLAKYKPLKSFALCQKLN